MTGSKHAGTRKGSRGLWIVGWVLAALGLVSFLLALQLPWLRPSGALYLGPVLVVLAIIIIGLERPR